MQIAYDHLNSVQMLATIEVLPGFKQIVAIIFDQENIRNIFIQAADRDPWPWIEVHQSSILALLGKSHWLENIYERKQ